MRYAGCGWFAVPWSWLQQWRQDQELLQHGCFNVVNFALPAAYSVTAIGVTPIVVVVNGDGTTNGFGDPGLTNITTGVLAQYLDGTFNQTQDALITPQVGSSQPVLTLIREPLFGYVQHDGVQRS